MKIKKIIEHMNIANNFLCNWDMSKVHKETEKKFIREIYPIMTQMSFYPCEFAPLRTKHVPSQFLDFS